jgi:ankyrin repeat protein
MKQSERDQIEAESLREAVRQDNLARVIELSSNSRIINLADDTGWTPLFEGAAGASTRILRALLDAGASNKPVDSAGLRASDWATPGHRQLILSYAS